MPPSLARVLVVFLLLALAPLVGCSPAATPVKAATTPPAPTAGPPPRVVRPIDPAVVAATTGATPEKADDVVKVSFPRTDLPVEVDGWTMPPFMGLTSWVAFTPGQKEGVEAMAMGDLVLFEDEVNPTMTAALENGLQVTALHNHFFFDKPHVYFMHVGGEGALESLGKAVRVTLDAQKVVRQRSAKVETGFGARPLPQPSRIDGARLDAIFGVKGTRKDGMYKAVMGRKATASCGCPIGKAMGVNTWAAFAGGDENAIVDGDFAVTESELQPVLKSLRSAGIFIVAIHSHMTGESPRIVFLHYWGRGPAADLAQSLKHALDLTEWDGRTQGQPALGI